MSDIDTWALEKAWGRFCEAIPSGSWSDDLEAAAKRVSREIWSLEAECSDCQRAFAAEFTVATYLWDLLAKVKLGVYDEHLHGNLREILETIERMGNERD